MGMKAVSVISLGTNNVATDLYHDGVQLTSPDLERRGACHVMCISGPFLSHPCLASDLTLCDPTGARNPGLRIGVGHGVDTTEWEVGRPPVSSNDSAQAPLLVDVKIQKAVFY